MAFVKKEKENFYFFIGRHRSQALGSISRSGLLGIKWRPVLGGDGIDLPRRSRPTVGDGSNITRERAPQAG